MRWTLTFRSLPRAFACTTCLRQIEPMSLRTLLETILRLPTVLLCVGLGLAGCSNTISAPMASYANGPDGVERTYRLGVGDKLKISVFGEENLSGPTEVNALGKVALPLAGELQAKGLGIDQFRDAVVRRLADGYLKNPKVTVEITNYRGIYVHGEIKQGGEFAYKPGMTIRDAVAVAGGYTYRSDDPRRRPHRPRAASERRSNFTWRQHAGARTLLLAGLLTLPEHPSSPVL
jgi:protein involved in polysaccharide export with SLBB domain